MKALITGGAGFIGSHLADALMERGWEVTILDNLSGGRLENISKWLNNQDFNYIKGDLLNVGDIKKAIKGCDTVFHLAANPDVRLSVLSPKTDLKQNIQTTFNLLEVMRHTSNCKDIIFTSSSTVYGEPKKIPVPEDYGPMMPISVYGATKLACEALILSYAYLFNIRCIILRLANIVGSRARRGVVYDFVTKLKRSPKTLEILGDGTQIKSYLHVKDCISAMLFALKRLHRQGISPEIYNVGSEDQITVKEVAKIIIDEIGLYDVRIIASGGTSDGRGWKGDVKDILLDITKLKRLGWKPKYGSKETVKMAARALLNELNERR